MCISLVVQAPQGFLENANVDVLLGRPFFENYYSIFNLNTSATSIGFVTTSYTISDGLSAEATFFVIILCVILIGGMIGCVQVYREYKEAKTLKS